LIKMKTIVNLFKRRKRRGERERGAYDVSIHAEYLKCIKYIDRLVNKTNLMAQLTETPE